MSREKIHELLVPLLSGIKMPDWRLTALTGAGISAESGIPTFRGPEGYWTVGSREYHPQEMATYAMFTRHPFEVWCWYLYRRGVCRNAEPNAAHIALARLERHFGDRFLLVTQNVDGLHLRAGSSENRTYQIHGNIDYFRCSNECTDILYRLDDHYVLPDKKSILDEKTFESLKCPECGRIGRPHVLWFDEYYDEAKYKFESSIRAAGSTDLLLVIGTSASTNLPVQIGYKVASKGGILVDINPETNAFSSLAEQSGNGFHLKGTAASTVPILSQVLETLS